MPEAPDLPSNFTLDDVAILLAVALLSLVSYFVLRMILTRAGEKVVSRNHPRLAMLLTQQSFFTSIALLGPVLILALVNPFLRQRFGWASAVYMQFVRCYLIAALGL